MPEPRDILIVGGYGVVGRRIAARLAPLFPDRIVIAGRSEAKAAALSGALGHGSRARRMDVDDAASVAAALDGVGTVMTCVAQRERHLLGAAIRRGVAYTDIAPRLAFWQGAEEMAAEARQRGARILLGAGLSPGISNMMAQRLKKALGDLEKIETAIFLSLGDEYGPDSLHHVLEAVTRPFEVLIAGERRPARPFSNGERVEFPEPAGARTAYLFPWSDVVYYPKTLGAATSIGRFALDPPWLGRLAAAFVRAGAQHWLKRAGAGSKQRRAIEQLKQLYSGRDLFGLMVTAESNGRCLRMSMVGRHQAEATAAGAAEFARALASEEITQAGVFLPEQVMSQERFFAALERDGLKPLFEEVSHRSHRSTLPLKTAGARP